MNREKEFWENEGAKIFLGGQYDSSKISEYEFKIIDKLILPTKSVLEIGPGSGRDLQKFKERDFNLNAIDISSPLIKNLKNKFSGRFLIGDVRDDILKFKNIGLIYSRWSILSLAYDDFKKFLKDCEKVLLPDGKALISLREGDSLENEHKKTKIQSLQMNFKHLVPCVPEKMKIDFLEVIRYKSKEEKEDRQITFIVSKSK